MARITVEDCVARIGNRFHLVLIATRRARQLAKGGTALIAEMNDKPTVVALWEIAEGKIDASILDKVPEETIDHEPEPGAVERPGAPAL